MIIFTMIYGAFLTVLGLFAYFGISSASITALIPTFFGAPILILAAIAKSDRFVAGGMHIISVLALIGFGATVPGFLELPALLSGGEVARPTAAAIQSVMCVASAVYVIASVAYFINRRRQRSAIADGE